MISVETTPDGFVLAMDGRQVLVHSARHPCLEIGSAQGSLRRGGGRGKTTWRNYQGSRLRTFRIEEATPETVVVDFEGRLRLTARFAMGKLRFTLSNYGGSINRLKLRLTAVPRESIFGCGERLGRLDLKGSLVPFWSEDRGGGRDVCPIPLASRLRHRGGKRRQATYFPQPSFLSSERYWVHVDTSAYAQFDFRNPRFSVLETWEVPKEIVLGWGISAAEALSGLSSHVGRPAVLPSWTRKGVCLGVQGGTEDVLRKVRGARDAGAQIGSVWVQDWCGRRSSRFGGHPFWNWRADTVLYPDLVGLIADLKERGVRFLGYINPYLALEGDLYAEAQIKGFCVRNPEGGDYMVAAGTSPAAMLDFTNPLACRWIKDIMKREMIGAGMSGWMADAGEFLPDDAVLHSGQAAVDLHNRWPLLWARVNREAVAEAGKEREIVVFHRSGWAGSSGQASAFWAGPQLASFDPEAGLASVVPAGISAGLSGAGFWHSDVGGCVSSASRPRKPECLKRWSEMAVFSPLFRTHEGNLPEANHQFWSNPEALRHFTRMTEIYAALGPYHEAVAREVANAGYPAIRHLWMHYEDDPNARSISYQYLYGRDILVAPVLKEGETLRHAYLPEDSWVHFWSSRIFRGGEVTLEAPLGYPLVFYRENSSFASLFDSIRRNAQEY